MKVTRVYAGSDGESYFEDRDFALLDQGSIGRISAPVPATSVMFRETGGDYNYDFHTAPQRQFIVLLDGIIEIETSLGDRRRFQAGEILLMEDTTGKGHRTRSIDGKLRRSLFITLD